MHYFTLDQESLDNITRKPNLTLDIPKSGYNFRATNYVASKTAEQTERCSFLDTTQYCTLATEDCDKADDLVIDACMNEKLITGEIGINPSENNFLLLDCIMNITAQTLSLEDVSQRRMIAPLTIAAENKESHGVALCIDSNKDKKHIDIIILEQHALRDGGKLDYSKEIDLTLAHLQKIFEIQGMSVNTYQNDKPICREKGVCGIVSAEVCKRLLQAENPIKTAQLGTIKISREKVNELHHTNFLNYQKDNPIQKENEKNYSR